MLEFESLSTKAKIGEVLILISLISKGIGLIGMMAFGPIFMLNAVMPFPAQGLFLVIGIVTLLGIVLGILSLKAVSNKRVHSAGIYAIIGCLLPPLDIVMLIGGILFLVSEEAS